MSAANPATVRPASTSSATSMENQAPSASARSAPETAPPATTVNSPAPSSGKNSGLLSPTESEQGEADGIRLFSTRGYHPRLLPYCVASPAPFTSGSPAFLQESIPIVMVRTS